MSGQHLLRATSWRFGFDSSLRSEGAVDKPAVASGPMATACSLCRSSNSLTRASAALSRFSFVHTGVVPFLGLHRLKAFMEQNKNTTVLLVVLTSSGTARFQKQSKTCTFEMRPEYQYIMNLSDDEAYVLASSKSIDGWGLSLAAVS